MLPNVALDPERQRFLQRVGRLPGRYAAAGDEDPDEVLADVAKHACGGVSEIVGSAAHSAGEMSAHEFVHRVRCHVPDSAPDHVIRQPELLGRDLYGEGAEAVRPRHGVRLGLVEHQHLARPYGEVRIAAGTE